MQILLYIDEASITADKGNRSKKNKLCFVYCSLGNLKRKDRSTFKAINLVAIFRNTTVKQFGLNVLLRPLVDDLTKLEEGVLMHISGIDRIVRGTLSAVIADNLGSHQIGCFKIGFSKGFRKCRFCLAVDDDIQCYFRDNQFIARDKIQHDQHCDGLSLESIKEHLERLYGITGTSILNELSHFHVIGGLPPDVIHDILEGILPFVISKVIMYCIKSKFFTLKTLNHIIENFNYGHREVIDKPCTIDYSQLNKGKMNHSAVQIWLLAINLPLMIGNFIGESDPVWHCFTTLLQISRLIFLESISDFEIVKLGLLIEEFCVDYKEHFFQSYKRDDPKSKLKCSIIPKMHHLVHYPRFIKLLGPLHSFWCMRFEAKHSYFKQLQRKIKNFIDPPYTLFKRHQQWQCNQFRSAVEMLLQSPILTSPYKVRLLDAVDVMFPLQGKSLLY